MPPPWLLKPMLILEENGRKIRETNVGMVEAMRKRTRVNIKTFWIGKSDYIVVDCGIECILKADMRFSD